MNTKRIGILCVLAASVAWAVEPVVIKLAYADNASFLQTVALRGVIMMLIGLIYGLIGKKENLRITKKEFSAIAWVALFGTLVADVIYFYTLTQIPVVNAALIAHIQPIFMILIGYFFLKEDKLTGFDYLGIFLMISAAVLVTTKNYENFSALKFGTLGDLLLLISTFAWAATAIVVRKCLKRLNAGAITFYRYFLSSVVLIGYLILNRTLAISNMYQIAAGVVASIGIIFYYESLRRMKAAQTSALELTSVFFAAVLGFLVLGEAITIMQMAGVATLFAGVYFLSKKEQIIS